MNVSAALDWLFSTQFFGIKLGLDNTEKLLAAAGADHINATVVHVALMRLILFMLAAPMAKAPPAP